MKFDVHQAEDYQDTERSVFFYVQSFDPLTSKHRGMIYSLRCTSVQSFKSVKQRVLKILSGQYIHMSSLTLDIKINRVHLLFWIYQCIKFEVCQSLWSIYYLGCTSVSVKQRVLKILNIQNIPIFSLNQPLPLTF
jgi:hypothetical protein